MPLTIIWGCPIDTDNPTANAKQANDFQDTFRGNCKGDLTAREVERIEDKLRRHPKLSEVLGGATTVKKFRKLDSAGKVKHFK